MKELEARFAHRFFIVVLLATSAILFAVFRAGGTVDLRQIIAKTETKTYLVDKEGRLVTTGERPVLPTEWPTEEELPKQFGEVRVTRDSRLSRRVLIAQVQASPPLYAVVSGTFDRRYGLYLFLPYLLAAALLTALVPAVGLAFFFRRRGREAESVLTRLRDGDLKARFRIGRLDEVGRTMVTFNAMADEIETLVGRLRAAESRRTQLLRELSHDLRTPLASMSYRVDTLLEGSSGPGGESARSLRAEFDYFAKLIEDLFLLAEADDPAARRTSEDIDPLEWLQETLSMVPFDSASHRLRLDADLPEEARLVADRQMLRRLLQNAVQNALHFAKREVVLKARVVGDGLELQVRDDGPGFSDEGIENFGRRRHTRLLEARGQTKISLGLGSVIIRRVCEMFRGQVEPTNWYRPSGELGGGELRIRLPLKFLGEAYRRSA